MILGTILLYTGIIALGAGLHGLCHLVTLAITSYAQKDVQKDGP